LIVSAEPCQFRCVFNERALQALAFPESLISIKQEDFMLNRITIGLMAGTLLATPALAQTSPAQPQGQRPATTAPATGQGSSAQGQNQAQGGNIQYVTQNRPDLWRASQLEGLNVYNQNNEKIGDIREVLVNRQGNVEAVVIGVGGFLGIGERDVAVPYNALQWVNDPARTAANTGAAGTGGAGMGAGGTTTTGTGAAGTGATASAPAGTIGAAGASNDTTVSTATNNNAQPATTGTVGTGNRATATAGDQMRDYPERVILPNATKEQLENAPQFRYAQ
jgi:sporulation protein YlmC with PRC-barrel domain